MSSQLRLTIYAALATLCATSALSSEFSGKGWVLQVVVAVLLVSGSCAAVRATTLPSAFEPILAAIMVLFWVAFLDARSSSHLGFIPARTGFRHLDRAARHGFTEMRKLPTPTPTHHGIVMLTVIGVAAVALVVDLLVVTLRRAALAGLPLLGLFTIGAATGHHGVGFIEFIIAASGYLILLYADNREKVARWGAAIGAGSKARPASTWSTDPSSAPPPASLGRRVGATAISLGVVVPILIPGLHTGIDQHHTGSGNGSGDGGGTTIVRNPIVSVASELTSTKASPVLSYQSSSTDPGYLRLTSLDSFDGTTFSAQALQQGPSATAGDGLKVEAPVPAVTASDPEVTTTVNVAKNAALRYAPAPATVVGTSLGGSWRYDPGTATVFSSATTTAGLSYTTHSIAAEPTAGQLNAAPAPNGVMAADLALPQGAISHKVVALTKRISAGATTEYQRAIDIQNFFTDGDRFTYDTTIPKDNSRHALSDFLFDTRKGFCQQFATSMAVMARIVGIPARVAVGFTAGTLHNGTYEVTTHDAHAWPELYFPDYGWLAFEPTPRADGQAVKPSYAQPKGTKTKSNTPTPVQSTSPHSFVPSNAHPHLGKVGGSVAGHSIPAIGTLKGNSYTAVLTALIVVAALVLLALPGLARLLVRRRRWRVLARDPGATSGAGGVAWVELRDSMIDLGVAWDDRRTPRQTAAALLSIVSPGIDTRDSLQRLARSEERARYAASMTTANAGGRNDIDLVRAAVAEGCSGWQRARARFLPASTLRVLGSLTRRASAQVARLDRIGSSLRRMVRARARLRLRT